MASVGNSLIGSVRWRVAERAHPVLRGARGEDGRGEQGAQDAHALNFWHQDPEPLRRIPARARQSLAHHRHRRVRDGAQRLGQLGVQARRELRGHIGWRPDHHRVRPPFDGINGSRGSLAFDLERFLRLNKDPSRCLFRH